MAKRERLTATRFRASLPDSAKEPAPRYAAINGLVPVKDRRMLQFLSRRTRVPQSEYLREAIRDLLRKYRGAFEGSPYEDEEPL